MDIIYFLWPFYWNIAKVATENNEIALITSEFTEIYKTERYSTPLQSSDLVETNYWNTTGLINWSLLHKNFYLDYTWKKIGENKYKNKYSFENIWFAKVTKTHNNWVAEEVWMNSYGEEYPIMLFKLNYTHLQKNKNFEDWKKYELNEWVLIEILTGRLKYNIIWFWKNPSVTTFNLYGLVKEPSIITIDTVINILIYANYDKEYIEKMLFDNIKENFPNISRTELYNNFNSWSTKIKDQYELYQKSEVYPKK